MTSPWEEEQMRRGRALLSDKQFNWPAQSRNPSGYEIWLKDAHEIWVEDSIRTVSISQGPFNTAPLMRVSIWSKFISFLKGFKKIAP